MTIEQRVAVLEEIFAKLRDYYILLYSGEEIDALLASAGVPIGITKEYQSVAEMNQNFDGTDVARGQFVLILPESASSPDYGKVYLKGTANWVYVFTLTSLTAIKGPQGPAGKTGAKGADGADGKNFMVLGYYETLSALNAAVPSPGTGDTYGVGTEPPYAFYMYDPTISNWRYVGNLQGPAGPTGGEDNFVRYDAAQSLTDEQKAQARTNIGADAVQGAVRYDAAQSLTDAQKTQARGNINAAPGGFGYGENRMFLKWDDNDGSQFEAFVDQMIDGTSKTVRLDGVADYPANVVSGNGGFADIKFDSSGNVLVLFHGPVNVLKGSIDGVYHASKKRLNDGTWLPWEYDNPPMKLGVEYRTTERYTGKPVYVKAVDCGGLPSNSTKTVSFDPSYDGVNTVSTFRALSVWGVTSDCWTLPALTYGYGLDRSVNISGYYNAIIIGTTETGATSSTVTAVVKYIKTID